MKNLSHKAASALGLAVFLIILGVVSVSVTLAAPERAMKVRGHSATSTLKGNLARYQKNSLSSNGRIMGTVASVKENSFTVTLSTNGTFLNTTTTAKLKKLGKVAVTTNADTKMQIVGSENRAVGVGDAVMVTGEMSTSTNRFVAKSVIVMPNSAARKSPAIKPQKNILKK